ncbi:MAG TPA: hypothetical protein VFH83_14090, partial [Spirochaetia bacterium]|nr:hypothetical protein [Spirochaetia bacterium]
MEIQRHFTRLGESPYEGIAFESRVSEIKNPDGKVIFRQENVTVPQSWSQIATDILAQKYFRKRGVPQTDGKSGGENDARQVFHRLAFTWMDWGKRHGYFASDADAQTFYDEMCFMLAHQMGAPNSPQWFNTGLFAVYGLKGPAQGHYFVNPKTMEVEKATSAYERPQPHACQPWHASVSTPFGPVAIGSIVDGGLVGLEVFDGTDEGRGTTRVVAVKENGVKPVFRVILENGTTVEATGDHLVLASRERGTAPEWVRMDALEAGMRLQVSTVSEAREVAVANRFPGKHLPAIREEPVTRLELAGLMRVYDIQTESGQYLSNNVIVHNCFILSVEDDLVNDGGIMDLMTREARLFKYGSGTGTNYSKLRSSSEPLSGGGVSSGLLSFLKVSDRSASSIKSGGTTRRAARMVTLDADHPDVFKYIDWKVQEERKVASMVTGSRILRRHTKRLLQACKPPAASNGNAAAATLDPRKNKELARAIQEALQEEVPSSWIYQVIQLAGQGIFEIEP